MNYTGNKMKSGFEGFTLIELMISMGLGLFFLSIATSFLLSSRIAHSTQDVDARLQENGRFAVTEMAARIRMASYVDWLSVDAQIPSGQFYTGACAGLDPCTADGGGNTPDRVAIMMNPPPDDGSDADCVGNPLDTDEEIAAMSVAVYLYLVGDDNGVSSLLCQTFLLDEAGVATAVNAQPQVAVPGVENMQLLYGVTDIEEMKDIDTRVEKYLRADQVDDLPVPVGALTPWVDIAAVQIAFLATSGMNDSDSANTAQRQYRLLDAPLQSFSDGARRQVFATTISVNNARD